MLSKFGSPARTHLLDLYSSKGANFESELQNVPNAIPNVVTPLKQCREEGAQEIAVAASGFDSKL